MARDGDDEQGGGVRSASAVRTAPDGPWPFVGRARHVEAILDSLVAGTVAGWLVVGSAGVGKSRLAAEVAAAAERLDHPVGHVVGSAALASIPLACLSHLLPAESLAGGDDRDLVRIAAAVRASLERPLVVHVDDIDQIDPASAVVLVQLMAAGAAFVVGTARTAAGVDDAIAALARSGRVGRLDLEALADDDVDALLHLALGGPVTAAAGRQLWSRSSGNVLFLRELVRAGRASGALVGDAGAWDLVGPLPTPAALRDLVIHRLADLPGDARDVLERVALCGPLGLADLERRGFGEALEHLEDAGLVEWVRERRRREVVVAHPLHAEVLRDELRASRVRQLYREEAEAVEAHGLRRRGDVWRVAGWRLEAGAPVDPDVLLAAAETALAAGDVAGVLRLGERLWADRRGARDGLVYGQALVLSGRAEEAEAVLGAAQRTARADPVAADPVAATALTLVADARSMNAFWGLSDTAHAVAVLGEAQDALPPGAEPALQGAQAWMLAFDGRPDEALDLLGSIDLTTPRARVVTAIPRATALTLVGRTVEAIDVARHGRRERIELGPDPVAAHPSLHRSTEIFALTEQGRLVEASELARLAHEEAVEEQDLFGIVFMGLSLGRLWLRRGRPVTARTWLRQVQPYSAALRPMHRLTMVGISVTSVLLGDLDAARAAHGAAAEVADGPAFLRPELRLAEGWLAWAEGRPAEARAALVAGADEAQATGQRTTELALLVDAARLGEAAGVRDRVEELARSSQSELAAAQADLVAGLASGDRERLAVAGARLEAMDAQVLAAEAFVALASAHRRAQSGRDAAAAEHSARVLIGSVEGARTPGLTLTSSVSPLSAREREVALLAAEGLSSPAIAERLYLSVRTVNNHLQNAYTKLGISGRGQLAAALGREDGPR